MYDWEQLKAMLACDARPLFDLHFKEAHDMTCESRFVLIYVTPGYLKSIGTTALLPLAREDPTLLSSICAQFARFRIKQMSSAGMR